MTDKEQLQELKEKDELWEQVKFIVKTERLDYGAMLAFGSVFGQIDRLLEKKDKRIEELENTLKKIKNTNTVKEFYQIRQESKQ
ncbi:hypothetical protein [Terrihalobacillus insolitus]|uniref:hypothetical protein n=1 Tax=Terrihalobacillus insolitus TaxID=2950438 RepID=UPI002341FFF4|nr:hypothetical protein [Terrihalobacillus insolitus]MDC3412544.1 hypothetical protein [Terrihalobacillus insolitus]